MTVFAYREPYSFGPVARAPPSGMRSLVEPGRYGSAFRSRYSVRPPRSQNAPSIPPPPTPPVFAALTTAVLSRFQPVRMPKSRALPAEMQKRAPCRMTSLSNTRTAGPLSSRRLRSPAELLTACLAAAKLPSARAPGTNAAPSVNSEFAARVRLCAERVRRSSSSSESSEESVGTRAQTAPVARRDGSSVGS